MSCLVQRLCQDGVFMVYRPHTEDMEGTESRSVDVDDSWVELAVLDGLLRRVLARQPL